MTYMTIEQFRQIHEDWKQSGLSVQQYCENTGLTESRFYYWKSKLKAESLPSACGSFIPVKMSGKSTLAERYRDQRDEARRAGWRGIHLREPCSDKYEDPACGVWRPGDIQHEAGEGLHQSARHATG